MVLNCGLPRDSAKGHIIAGGDEGLPAAKSVGELVICTVEYVNGCSTFDVPHLRVLFPIWSSATQKMPDVI